MFFVKLCFVALMYTSTGTCQGNSFNSSSSSVTSSHTRRMASDQAASLRRQLMRDNYDYSHSEDERKQPNVSAKRENTANVYYQKGTHYLPASEVAKSNSETYSAEHDQNEQSGQHKQDGQLEQDDQNEPPGKHKQLSQYEQPSQNEHHGQREQYGQEKQINQYTRTKKPRPAWSEQEQQGQFNGQDQAQYEEQTDRARPSYADPDELTVRDVIEPKYTLDIDLARRHIEPQQAQAMAYNPSYHKQRDTYNSYRGEEQQPRPFGDLRGNFKEQYEQNGAIGQPDQVDQVENEDYNPEEQEAIDQQNISDSQDDGRSDYSQSKKQSRELYNEFGHTTRANRLQYYTRAPAARVPTYRGHNSPNYQDPYEQPGRTHLALPGRNHYAPSSRNRNTPRGGYHYGPPSRNQYARPGRNHHASLSQNDYKPPQSDRRPLLDHNISKKDLLYYMDDTQLRRHNNGMSPDVPDEDEAPSLRPSKSSRVTPSNPRAYLFTTKPQNLPNTERARKSFVVTVSPGNVTYKLLTLKSREGGRRRGERRILEERGPEGVAIISLDHAPLPAFRLPRSRRQYMNNHRHGHQKPVLT